MRGFRSFLATMYGLIAAISLYRLLARQFVHPLAPTHPTHPIEPWMKLAADGLYPVIIVIYGMASLTYYRRHPSARAWGVMAGLVNLGIAVLVFMLLHTLGQAPVGRIIEDEGLLVVLGIGSVSAFAAWNPSTKDEGARRVKPRIKGDGTHVVLDALPLLLTLVGYMGGLELWYRWSESSGLNWNNRSGWFWPELLLASLVTTFVHECGHALTARLTGMRLRGFAAGPLQWRVLSGRWEFKFRWSGLLSAEGATRFDLNDPALKKRSAIVMIAAGPIANLFLGAAATWFVRNAVDAPWERASMLLAFISTFSLIAFIVNLIPARSGQNYTDGAKIWQLLSGHSWEEFHGTGDEQARMKGLQCLMVGNAVEAEAQFRAALGDGTGLARDNHVRLLVCLADALQDQERFEEARGYLETALGLGDETGSGQGSMCDILLQLGSDPRHALAMADEACRLNVARIRKDRGTGEDRARVRMLARQAQAYAQLDESTRAGEAIAEAMRLTDAALAARTDAQRRGPGGADLVFGRPTREIDDLLLAYSCYLVGRSLRAMNRDDRATQYLRTARDLDLKGTIRIRAQRDLDRMGSLAWR